MSTIFPHLSAFLQNASPFIFLSSQCLRSKVLIPQKPLEEKYSQLICFVVRKLNFFVFFQVCEKLRDVSSNLRNVDKLWIVPCYGALPAREQVGWKNNERHLQWGNCSWKHSTQLHTEQGKSWLQPTSQRLPSLFLELLMVSESAAMWRHESRIFKYIFFFA